MDAINSKTFVLVFRFYCIVIVCYCRLLSTLYI